MSSIKGMQISSMDAYIQEVPEKAFAQVYELVDDSYQLVAEQEFTPAEESWNHVTFQTPYVISGKNIIYAVKLTGMVENHYYIGIDGTSAVRGYGDLCNVGGETWWSMADLGIDNNFCVRANVTGERTPDISWLSVNKTQLSLQPGSNEDVQVTINRNNLSGDSYEARVILTTNDPLSPTVKIPVYMTSNLSGIMDTTTLAGCNVKVVGGNLEVASDKEIASVVINSVAGMTTGLSTKTGNNVTVSLDNCATGVYVIRIKYTDGTHETMKMAIKR